MVAPKIDWVATAILEPELLARLSFMEPQLEHSSSAPTSSEATAERASKQRQSEKRFNLYSVLEIDIKVTLA